ncbi:hypothetical protein H310_00445 [Aphanomyces invadans]|uniref:Uncharacterized protein n=1 Tax=Aphanomyces invadans TaxID=157072 RepID=A0A024UVV2_9STRA|nr:hypothetical protein H310_00445 [Aphanomyces invadans]ETW10057.1 hypothetical protein H310_00445 [Aphanomyces invadans]|eukprot:XP_008861468.1 hypothetical protein H310_00445 [Aphanomyces invadans]
MSSTMRNRFVNEGKQGTTEVQNVALGPKVYDGERYGKMSERLKRQKIEIKVNDRNPRFYGFIAGFVFLILIFLWVQISGAMRSRRVAN